MRDTYLDSRLQMQDLQQALKATNQTVSTVNHALMAGTNAVNTAHKVQNLAGHPPQQGHPP